jgi:hypothetical protein
MQDAVEHRHGEYAVTGEGENRARSSRVLTVAQLRRILVGDARQHQEHWTEFD